MGGSPFSTATVLVICTFAPRVHTSLHVLMVGGMFSRLLMVTSKRNLTANLCLLRLQRSARVALVSCGQTPCHLK